tara:strand:- start:5464 stop:6549 length:1086 start_codon:yes stop_codon:yes gene_type:complete
MKQRILIIGAGAIAHHHAAAARLLGCEDLLVADPSATARAKFASDFPEARLFESASDMFADGPAGPKDIAVIAVPPWLHAKYSIGAFDAGLNVLCEKPLGRDIGEVNDIIAAAVRSGRLLGDCSNRFNDQPAMRRARELIGQGALGPMSLIRMTNRHPRRRTGIEYQPESRWFLNREMAGGGVFMDWSVYDIAMLFDVLMPKGVTIKSASVSSIESSNDPTDVPIDVEFHGIAMMELDLPNGQQVPFIYERASGVHGLTSSELSIDGRNGGMSWQWLPPYEEGMTTVTRYIDAGASVEERTERLSMKDQPHFHHQPLVAFAKRVAGKPSASLDENTIRFNFALIAGMYAVAQSGKSFRVEK